jgi:hypothetical protein
MGPAARAVLWDKLALRVVALLAAATQINPGRELAALRALAPAAI